MKPWIFLAIRVAIVAVVVIASPVATIWALDTLFGASIPLTGGTWLAMLWLINLFRPELGVTAAGSVFLEDK